MKIKLKAAIMYSIMIALITIVSMTHFLRGGNNTPLVIEGVSLSDKTFTYDGLEHSLEVEGEIPSGVTITYQNNNQTEAGEYTVSAKLSSLDNKYAEKTLSAKLNIIIGDGSFSYVLTSDGKLIATKYLGSNKDAVLPKEVFFKNELRPVVSVADDFNYNDLNYTVYEKAQYLGTEDNPYMILVSVLNDEKSSLITVLDGSLDNVSPAPNTLILHKDCTSIATRAFENCNNLTSVQLSKNIISIGLEAFKDCTSLVNLQVGGIEENELSNLSLISSDCFKDSPIETAIIPANLISYINKSHLNTINVTCGAILDNAFLPSSVENSSTLQNVTISNFVTSIGDYAFNGCTGLNYFYDDDTNPTAKYLGNDSNEKLALVEVLGDPESFVINNDTKFVLSEAFKDLIHLYSVTIGNGVKEIRKDAFVGNYRLVEYMDASVDKVSQKELTLRSGLKEYIIIENVENADSIVTKTNDFVFVHKIVPNVNNEDELCYYLIDYRGNIGTNENKATAIFPDKNDIDPNLVNYYINGHAFYNYENIDTLTISDDVTRILDDTAFVGCGFVNVNMPALGIAFVPKNTISRLVITSGVEIPNDAYRLSNTLTYVEIADSITNISTGSFYNCPNLKTLKIGNGVTRISENTFDYSPIETASVPAIIVPYLAKVKKSKEALVNLTVTSGTEIERLALQNCINLKNINISRTVTTIGERAFEGCTKILANQSGVNNLQEENGCYYITDTASTPQPLILVGVSNTNIESVSVNENCTIIYDNAFDGCNQLNTVSLPSGLKQVGKNAFDDSPIEVATMPSFAAISIPHDNLRQITINGGEKIDDYAFVNSSKLETVILPSSILTIGAYAFRNCSNLVNLVLPSSLETIEQYAFADCSSLKGNVDGLNSVLVIPDSVTVIKDSTFENCSSLENVTLSNSLEEIQPYAFMGCSNLKRISIPDSVIRMGEKVTYVDDVINNLEDPELGNVFIEKIGKVFAGDTSLNEVVLGNGLTVLQEDTFQNCTSLKTVTFGTSINEIARGAFYNCASLDNVDLVNTKIIRKAAFQKCSGLTTINLGKNEIIYEEAFAECTSLYEIVIPNTTEIIGALEGVEPTEYNNHISDPQVAVFNGCNNLVRVTLGTLVERQIEESTFDSEKTYYLFEKVENLESFAENVDYFTIDSNKYVTKVDTSEVSKPNSETDYYTVAEANNLTDFADEKDYYELKDEGYVLVNKTNNYTVREKDANNALTSIWPYTFYSCRNLYEVYNFSNLNVELGKTSNGYVAFYAQVLHTQEETSLIDDETSQEFVFVRRNGRLYLTKFVGESSTETITLPKFIDTNSNVVPYIVGQHAFNAIKFKHLIIPNDSMVVEIEEHAFEECRELLDIQLGDNMTKIGAFAFANCTKLNNVIVPDSVTTIGQAAFSGNTSLNNIKLSDSMTELANQLFMDCTSFTTFTVPSNITKINNGVFTGCSNITSFVLHDNIQEIGNSAFSDCISLTNIVLPKELKKVSGALLKGCTSLNTVVLQSAINEIEGFAFQGINNSNLHIYYIGTQNMYKAIKNDVANRAYYPCFVIAGISWQDMRINYDGQEHTFKGEGDLTLTDYEGNPIQGTPTLTVKYYDNDTITKANATSLGVSYKNAGKYYVIAIFNVGSDVEFEAGVNCYIDRIPADGFVFEDTVTTYDETNQMLNPTLPSDLGATYTVKYIQNDNYHWKTETETLFENKELNQISLIHAGIYEISIIFDSGYLNYQLPETITITLEIKKAKYPYPTENDEDMHLSFKSTGHVAGEDEKEHKGDMVTKAFTYDGKPHVLELNPVDNEKLIFGTTTDLSPFRQYFSGDSSNVVYVDYATLYYSTKIDDKTGENGRYIDASECINAGRYAVIAQIVTYDYEDINFYEAFEILKAEYNTENLVFEDRSYPYEDNQTWKLEVSGIIPSGVVVSYTNNRIESSEIDKTKAENRFKVVATFLCDTTNYFSIPTKEAYLTIINGEDDFAGIKFEDETYFYDIDLGNSNPSHNLVVSGAPANATITYKVRNAKTNEETASSASSPSYKEVGTYIYTATVEINSNTHNYIAVLTINDDPLSNAVLEDKKFVYDGEAKTLLVGGNIPTIGGNEAVITYTTKSDHNGDITYQNVSSYSYTNAGVYEIRATISLAGKTREIVAVLTIVRANYIMENVTFEDGYFAFDGEKHEIGISTIPEGLTVTYTLNPQPYEKINGTDTPCFPTEIGEYDVTAQFGLTEEYMRNYVIPEKLEARLSIMRAMVKAEDGDTEESIVEPYSPTLENTSETPLHANGKRYVYLRDAVENAPTDGRIRKVWLISHDYLEEIVYEKNQDGSFKLDEDGKKIPAVKKDENGNEMFNADDTPIYETEKTLVEIHDDSGYSFVVKAGQNVIIDLVGKTYTFKDIFKYAIKIEKGATLTITNGKLEVNSVDTRTLVENYGTLNISDVTISDMSLERVFEMLYGTLNINSGNSLSTLGELISIYYGTVEDDENASFAINVNLNDVLVDTIGENKEGNILSGKISYGSTNTVDNSWEDRIKINFNIINLEDSNNKNLTEKLTFVLRPSGFDEEDRAIYSVPDYDNANIILTLGYKVVRTVVVDGESLKTEFKINKSDVKVNGYNYETISDAIGYLTEKEPDTNQYNVEVITPTVRIGDVTIESGKELIINLNNKARRFIEAELVGGDGEQSVTIEKILYGFDVKAGGKLVIMNGIIEISAIGFKNLIRNEGNLELRNVEIRIIDEDQATTDKSLLEDVIYNIGTAVIDGLVVNTTLNTIDSCTSIIATSHGDLIITGATKLSSGSNIMLIDARYDLEYESGLSIVFESFVRNGKLDGIFLISNKTPNNSSIWKNRVNVDMTELIAQDFGNLKFKSTATDVEFKEHEISLKPNYRVIKDTDNTDLYSVHRTEITATVNGVKQYYETLKAAIVNNYTDEFHPVTIEVEFNDIIDEFLFNDIDIKEGQNVIFILNNENINKTIKAIGKLNDENDTPSNHYGIKVEKGAALTIKNGTILQDDNTMATLIINYGNLVLENATISDYLNAGIEHKIKNIWIDGKLVDLASDFFDHTFEYMADTLKLNGFVFRFELTDGSTFDALELPENVEFIEINENIYEAQFSYENVRKVAFTIVVKGENQTQFDEHDYQFLFTPRTTINKIWIDDNEIEKYKDENDNEVDINQYFIDNYEFNYIQHGRKDLVFKFSLVDGLIPTLENHELELINEDVNTGIKTYAFNVSFDDAKEKQLKLNVRRSDRSLEEGNAYVFNFEALNIIERIWIDDVEMPLNGLFNDPNISTYTYDKLYNKDVKFKFELSDGSLFEAKNSEDVLISTHYERDENNQLVLVEGLFEQSTIKNEETNAYDLVPNTFEGVLSFADNAKEMSFKIYVKSQIEGDIYREFIINLSIETTISQLIVDNASINELNEIDTPLYFMENSEYKQNVSAAEEISISVFPSHASVISNVELNGSSVADALDLFTYNASDDRYDATLSFIQNNTDIEKVILKFNLDDKAYNFEFTHYDEDASFKLISEIIYDGELREEVRLITGETVEEAENKTVTYFKNNNLFEYNKPGASNIIFKFGLTDNTEYLAYYTGTNNEVLFNEDNTVTIEFNEQRLVSIDIAIKGYAGSATTRRTITFKFSNYDEEDELEDLNIYKNDAKENITFINGKFELGTRQNVYVANETSEIYIDYLRKDDRSRVSGAGLKQLHYGLNTFEVDVYSEYADALDKTPRTYTINVYRSYVELINILNGELLLKGNSNLIAKYDTTNILSLLLNDENNNIEASFALNDYNGILKGLISYGATNDINLEDWYDRVILDMSNLEVEGENGLKNNVLFYPFGIETNFDKSKILFKDEYLAVDLENSGLYKVNRIETILIPNEGKYIYDEDLTIDSSIDEFEIRFNSTKLHVIDNKNIVIKNNQNVVINLQENDYEIINESARNILFLVEKGANLAIKDGTIKISGKAFEEIIKSSGNITLDNVNIEILDVLENEEFIMASIIEANLGDINITGNTNLVTPDGYIINLNYINKAIYKIEFDTNGGSEVLPVYVEKGKYLKEPSTPFKAKIGNLDQNFVGWFNYVLKSETEEYGKDLYYYFENNQYILDSNDSITQDRTYYKFVEFDFENTPILSDIKLYAKWENASSVVVSFDSDGGDVSVNQVIQKGDKVNQIETPYKENYTFKGWFNYVLKPENETYAQNTYYYLDNGVYILDTKEELTQDRTYYKFVEFDFDTEVYDDLSLIGTWILTSEITANTVSFYSNGVIYKTISVEQGKLFIAPNVTREGYELVGWYTSADNGETLDDVFDFSNSINADLNLYAGWEAISTTVNPRFETPVLSINGNEVTWVKDSLATNGYEIYLDNVLQTTNISEYTVGEGNEAQNMMKYTITTTELGVHRIMVRAKSTLERDESPLSNNVIYHVKSLNLAYQNFTGNIEGTILYGATKDYEDNELYDANWEKLISVIFVDENNELMVGSKLSNLLFKVSGEAHNLNNANIILDSDYRLRLKENTLDTYRVAKTDAILSYDEKTLIQEENQEDRIVTVHREINYEEIPTAIEDINELIKNKANNVTIENITLLVNSTEVRLGNSILGSENFNVELIIDLGARLHKVVNAYNANYAINITSGSKLTFTNGILELKNTEFSTFIINNGGLYFDNSEIKVLETTTVSISFDSKGGTAIDELHTEKGGTVSKPTDPTRIDTNEVVRYVYEFAGWYTSNNNGTTLSDTPFDFTSPITANIKLYAKWNVSQIKFDVTFVADEHGINPEPLTNVTKLPDVLPEIDDVDGYRLVGWSLGSESNELVVAGSTITENTTLYGVWEQIPEKEIIDKTINASNITGIKYIYELDYEIENDYFKLDESGNMIPKLDENGDYIYLKDNQNNLIHEVDYVYETIYEIVYETDSEGAFILDENGDKVPQKQQVYEKDENGDYILDENNNHIPVLDINGDPLYENVTIPVRRVVFEDGKPKHVAYIEENYHYDTTVFNISEVTNNYIINGIKVDKLYTAEITEPEIDYYYLNLSSINNLRNKIFISEDGSLNANKLTEYNSNIRFELSNITNERYDAVFVVVYATDTEGEIISDDYKIYAIIPTGRGANPFATIADIKIKALDKDDNEVEISYSFDKDNLTYNLNLPYTVAKLEYKIYALEEGFEFIDSTFVKTTELIDDVEYYVFSKIINIDYGDIEFVYYGLSRSLKVSYYRTETITDSGIEYTDHQQIYTYNVTRNRPDNNKNVNNLTINGVNKNSLGLSDDNNKFIFNYPNESSLSVRFTLPSTAISTAENNIENSSVVANEYIYTVSFGDNNSVELIFIIKSQEDIYHDNEGTIYHFLFFKASEDLTLESVGLYNNSNAKDDMTNANYKLPYKSSNEFSFNKLNQTYISNPIVKHIASIGYVNIVLPLNSKIRTSYNISYNKQEVTPNANNEFGLSVGDNIITIYVESELAQLLQELIDADSIYKDVIDLSLYTKNIIIHLEKEDKYESSYNTIIDALYGSVNLVNGGKLTVVQNEDLSIKEDITLVNVYYGTDLENSSSTFLYIDQGVSEDENRKSSITGTVRYGLYYNHIDNNWFEKAKIDVSGASASNLSSMEIKIQGDMIQDGLTYIDSQDGKVKSNYIKIDLETQKIINPETDVYKIVENN